MVRPNASLYCVRHPGRLRSARCILRNHADNVIVEIAVCSECAPQFGIILRDACLAAGLSDEEIADVARRILELQAA